MRLLQTVKRYVHNSRSECALVQPDQVEAEESFPGGVLYTRCASVLVLRHAILS